MFEANVKPCIMNTMSLACGWVIGAAGSVVLALLGKLGKQGH